MKFIKLLLLTSILLLSSQIGWAQYQLQKSNIPIIDKITENYRGRSLSLRELDAIVREISQDGLFQVVKVRRLKGNNVIIDAQQSAKLTAINITGNTSYSKEQLIEEMGIKTGQVISQLEISQAIQKITESYQRSGFYNFQITYDRVKTDDGIVLNIEVDEQDYCIIEDIIIRSKNPNLKEKLTSHIESFIKSNYKQNTTTELKKKITEFLLDERYLTAKVTNSGTIFNESKTRVKLTFSIDNPVQFEFIFNGNKYFNHFDLIKASKIGGKFLYLSDSSSEIVDSITALYLKSGFPEIKIQYREEAFASLFKRVLIFQIDEGPQIRIGRVNITGKISRPKSYYADKFLEFLGEQAHSVYFVKEDVQSAAEALITHLKREGHLMAELLSVNSNFNEYNNAEITIQIDEGILTYVRQILFRGAKAFSNLELRDQVGIAPNRPLKISEIEESFDKLSLFYKKRAYLEFKIKNANSTVIQYTPGQPYADIVFQIHEGPKIVAKDIVVRGAERTHHYVLFRELDFVRGDYLTLDRVATSIDRLEKTGLFGKVNIRSLEQGIPDGNRTIVVEVEERKPGLFSSGIGLENQGRLTYRGYLGLLYNNMWGKARGFTGRVDASYRDDVPYILNTVALSYYEPFIFENRVRGRLSLVRDQDIFQLPADGQPAVIQSTNEIRLQVEKEFTRKYRLTYRLWTFSNQEQFNTKDKNSFGTVNIATTGPIFELDFRNDQFLPTDGSYSRLEVEYASPFLGSTSDDPDFEGPNPAVNTGDDIREVNYFKSTFTTTHYIPLTKSKRWVWANSVRGGFLANLGGHPDSGVPSSRSFFLGGSSTIRGFFSIGAQESVPGLRELCIRRGEITAAQATGLCNLARIFTEGQSTFFLVKSELRFPISGNFGGHVFYDGGAVQFSDISIEDPYRDSVGFGFRYDTPVGAFVLELGYKLDRKLGGLGTIYDNESDIAIHLAIGTL